MGKATGAREVFNKNAQLYQDKYMDVSQYSDGLDKFCDLLPPATTVLEIACGPGNITKYLLQKRDDLHMLCTDIAPAMLELAAKNNPQVQTQLLHTRDMLTLNRKFHGIICGFCLPYLTKEEVVTFAQDSATLLHPGGILYLSAIQDDHAHSGIEISSAGDEVMMYYYEEAFLTHLLGSKGFEIIHLKQITYAGWKGEVTDIDIVARLAG